MIRMSFLLAKSLKSACFVDGVEDSRLAQQGILVRPVHFSRDSIHLAVHLLYDHVYVRLDDVLRERVAHFTSELRRRQSRRLYGADSGW